MRDRIRKSVDGRDLHLYPGITALGVGVGVAWGIGAGIAAGGLVLLLIGVFGLPAWGGRERRRGDQ